MSSSKAALDSAVEDRVSSAASRWPTFVFRGLINLLFGVLFLVYPDTALDTITRIFGAYSIIDGLFCLLAVALLCRSGATFSLYGPYMMSFLTSFIIGIVSVVYPNFTTETFFVVAGVWFLLIGLSEITVACILRQGLSGASTGCVLFGGLLYIVFAIILLANPAAAVTTYARLAGVVIVIFGLEVSLFGFALRRIAKNSDNDGGEVNLSSNAQAISMV